MKVQAIERSTSGVGGGPLTSAYAAIGPGSNPLQRECSGDVRRQSRNLNPQYHPLQRAREYARAVTAAKLNRMFAHPLIGNFQGNGHSDAVTATAISRRSLLPLISGSADGNVQLWDLATRTCMASLYGHSRSITGLVFDISGEYFYSCSDDGLINQWSVHPNNSTNENANDDEHDGHVAQRKGKRSAVVTKLSGLKDTETTATATARHGPVATWRTSGSFKSLDHHWMDPQFASASDEAVQIWTPERSTALQTFPSSEWFSQSTYAAGAGDTVNVVRYNPSERCLLAHCSVDRGIGLHDTRTGTALRKTVLHMRSNDLQWNPMEPMIFAVANEDHCVYTFDMRHLQHPTRFFKGHVSAVLSLAWAPSGREFVTGSYDRTLRIFATHTNNPGAERVGTAREIYHTARMQRVFTVNYTMDNKFIISGSDDTNLRLWKAVANDQLGQRTRREETSQQYRQALIRRYQHLPDVKRIYRSRKVPKTIKKQTAQAVIQKESADRKQANRVKYSKNGEHQFVSVKNKVVVKKIA